MAAVEAPERRLKLVRVKRKREAEAPEDLGKPWRPPPALPPRRYCPVCLLFCALLPPLHCTLTDAASPPVLSVVEGLEAPGKRPHISLSSAMAGLGLGSQAAAEEAAAQAPSGECVDAAAAAPAVRRQRFRRLSTLSAAQLRSIDGDQLASLLAAQQQAAAARRAGVKSSDPSGTGAAAAAATAGRAAQQLQAGQAARYEQIRRRRGLAEPASGASGTAALAEADPLQQLASVYDLVRRDDNEEVVPAGATPLQPPQRRSRAERAAAQYAEGTLLCNYMPMVREYLASQGRPLPAEGEVSAGAGSGQPSSGADSQQPGASSAGSAQQVPPSGSQGHGPAGPDGEGEDYVYDIYAALSEDERGEGGEAEAQWWELHASGAAPVVQVGNKQA